MNRKSVSASLLVLGFVVWAFGRWIQARSKSEDRDVVVIEIQ